MNSQNNPSTQKITGVIPPRPGTLPPPPIPARPVNYRNSEESAQVIKPSETINYPRNPNNAHNSEQPSSKDRSPVTPVQPFASYEGLDFLPIGDANYSVSNVPVELPPSPPKKPSKYSPYKPSPNISNTSKQLESQTNRQKVEQPLSQVPSIVAISSQGTPLDASQTSSQREKPVQKNIGFTLWAHNLGYASGFSCLLFGLLAISWSQSVQKRPAASLYLFVYSFCGPYSAVLGTFILITEYFLGLKSLHWLQENRVGRSPIRACFYLLTSIGTTFSYPTLLATFPMLVCAISNWMAYKNNELITNDNIMSAPICCKCKCFEDQKLSEELVSDNIKNELTLWEKFLRWQRRMDEIGYFGQILFVSLYILINVILFFQRLATWNNIVSISQQNCPNHENEFNCVSWYAPWAKAFGQILNFNCALILLPVIKTLIYWLNGLQQGINSEHCGRLLRRLTPPLRKNILFHILIAIVVLSASIGHILFHYLNLSVSPEITVNKFGVSAFVTGYIITYAMYIIYTAAQFRVKRANYELFFYSHHSFVIFFIFMLWHAPVFWIWVLLPLTAYVFERIYRESKRRDKFYVSNVTYIKPVMCISFFPGRSESFSFKEGQFIYVLVPKISKFEWHPFTISSAHEEIEKKDGEITIHIRVQKPGSWTHSVCSMFEEMVPPSGKSTDRFVLNLHHLDNTGNNIRGKHMGPDGKPLLLIDGPYSAPAQHYSEFKEIMLVGAGIGITPSSAIIQSILRHKWRKGFSPDTIYFFLIIRHEEIFPFRWFIKLLVELQQLVSNDFACGNLSSEKNRLEFHLFVTQAPKKTSDTGMTRREPSLLVETQQRVYNGNATRAGMQVDIGFTHADLESVMLNPSVSSSKFSEILSGTYPPENKYQQIYIWEGRPLWEDIFSHVKHNRKSSTKEIGVCFCGTPAIGKDLGSLCSKYSSLEEDLRLILLKENF